MLETKFPILVIQKNCLFCLSIILVIFSPFVVVCHDTYLVALRKKSCPALRKFLDNNFGVQKKFYLGQVILIKRFKYEL